VEGVVRRRFSPEAELRGGGYGVSVVLWHSWPMRLRDGIRPREHKSLQKLNEDCEKLRGQLKELEEAALPIARLLVPHPGGPKIAPLVDRLREALGHLATYVKHLSKSIPNLVLAYMKSYFPKAPVDVVAGGLAANYTDEQYAELLEQMAPIAEQDAEKLNLQ
jgi:hypothetical protein